ncbi:GTPase Era [Candidatus Pantoea edessiphila]|uniref:GTPase Era n=1 Tax=Candidatus Pantoea edessiphila TaxID=2044610 RepID=A0A2P5SYD9_9GAMM|nr:GTPase Era [Candidatus Pantoea edessiphila]MBK4775528.1 GTPase Era [Pantoea sp. Edef]PPI87346.1 GTPase Era [Candidatus Pantoea edessiphila]
MNNYITFCGVVSIIGRSNVGKSTLINKLLGEKISITSCKSNTTRQCITGIYTEDQYQIIYLDTPGLNINNNKLPSNKNLQNLIKKIIKDVNLVILVIDGKHWTFDDELILNEISNITQHLIVVINKIDVIKNKIYLLPYIEFLSKKIRYLEIVPVSAKTGKNVNIILDIIKKQLPKNDHYYSKEHITTCSERFIASEIIREKLMRFFGEEIPYRSIVEIENFINKQNNYDINGVIIVRHNSQKKIIIGHKGNKIKIIGEQARLDMEKIFKTQVRLYLWVKVGSSVH